MKTVIGNTSTAVSLPNRIMQMGYVQESRYKASRKTSVALEYNFAVFAFVVSGNWMADWPGFLFWKFRFLKSWAAFIFV